MIASLTSAHIDRTETERTLRRIIFDTICVAVLIASFLNFSLAAPQGRFRGDELGSIGIYWRAIKAIYCVNKSDRPGFAGVFSTELVDHRLDPTRLCSWVVAALVGL
jgi:hypothetical protein